jgi:dTDP-glucose 4,6-dehydratase
MKKILITGGAGFIAQHLIYNILTTADWDIIVLDRLDFSGNLNRLHDLLKDFPLSTQSRVKIVFHDLKAELNHLVRSDIGPVDYIAHLAAGSHVDRSIQRPMEFVLDNVVGTCNILDYARSLDSLERFMYFSTDEVFGTALVGTAYKENDRYNATNPYSASKAGGEELAVAYENTYNLPVYITHTTNVFGERQHPEKFIPLCIKKIRDGETILIHTDHNNIPGSRHYIHGADVADGVMFLFNNTFNFSPDQTGAKCPKFNLAGNEEIDNLQLAQYIAEVMNKPLNYKLVSFNSSRPGHDFRYAMDGSKMKSLGWEPKADVKQRIKEVVEWTLKNDRWL